MPKIRKQEQIVAANIIQNIPNPQKTIHNKQKPQNKLQTHKKQAGTAAKHKSPKSQKQKKHHKYSSKTITPNCQQKYTHQKQIYYFKNSNKPNNNKNYHYDTEYHRTQQNATAPSQ